MYSGGKGVDAAIVDDCAAKAHTWLVDVVVTCKSIVHVRWAELGRARYCQA